MVGEAMALAASALRTDIEEPSAGVGARAAS
jgi:hypothetical protein